jgi:hypothetical protein
VVSIGACSFREIKSNFFIVLSKNTQN